MFLPKPAIVDAAQNSSDDRCDPEEPQLLDGPAAGKQGHAGAAGRIDRGVGDRYADQVDQGLDIILSFHSFAFLRLYAVGTDRP